MTENVYMKAARCGGFTAFVMNSMRAVYSCLYGDLAGRTESGKQLNYQASSHTHQSDAGFFSRSPIHMIGSRLHVYYMGRGGKAAARLF